MSRSQSNPGRMLWLAALLYTAFVVYGSLVPLEYRAIPWDNAVARFAAIPWLELGVGSRADWVANLILYIPLGYLWLGAMAGRSKQAAVWGVSLFFSGLAIAGIALSIEFAQQFFPPRTVSLNDLFAEFMGGALGMLLWALTGRLLSDIWRRFAQGGPQSVRSALVGYVLAYLFLSLFPYDFLLGAVEWRTHLTADKAGWLFVGSCGLGCGLKLVPEMLAAIPFGLLLVNKPGRFSLVAAAGVGILLGLTIEILQLGIASGISQGASVFSRAAGVVLGAWLPTLFSHWNQQRMRPWVRAGLVAAVVPYAFGLAWLNQWFDAPWVNADAAITRLAEVRFIPFYYHYYTSEAVALVSLLFQFGLYTAVGVGVWLWRQQAWQKPQGAGVPALLAVVAAAVIETGKLFVPSQHPDPSNLLIAATAAGGCYAILSWLFSSSRLTGFSRGVAGAAEWQEMPKPDQAEPHSSPFNRLVALGLLAAALFSMVDYPLGWAPLLLLLALAAICWRWPGSWLIVVPAALPLLDLSYLSGRLFWSEFDTLLLLILAAAYARERVVPSMTWPGRIPLAVYAASGCIGLMVGLLPLAPMDLNAFAQYTSSYHALHAVKGLAFALAFLPLIKAEWHKHSGQFTARLALGMALGLAFELLFVLWERATYSGLWNFETDYRITGSFPGMHIGGASIEAYLVLAAPFVWLWAWQRQRAWAMLIAGGLYALAAYGVMVTFSRGGQAAFVVATLLTLAGFSRLIWKTRKRNIPGILILLVGLVAAGLVAWPVVSGKFSQSRLATIQADIGTRTAHWQDALDILSQAGNPLWGAGAGTFPAAFYWYSSAPARPATYAFAREGDNEFLRLGGGESLYFEQVVAVEPGRTYRLQLDVRASSDSAALKLPVCEKAILYSYTCAWNTLKFTSSDSQWQRHEISFHTDRFGPPGSWLQRPISLSMFNQDKASLIDVDNVRLLDDVGRNLVRNGDFSKGMQRWFFSVDNFWPWHIENNLIHVLFEQGWLGLATFVALLATVMMTLLKRVASDAFALTLFISLAAFMIVGLVNSPIDVPRLAFLFFWLAAIALISGGKVLPRRRRPSSVRSRRKGHEGAVQS